MPGLNLERANKIMKSCRNNLFKDGVIHMYLYEQDSKNQELQKKDEIDEDLLKDLALMDNPEPAARKEVEEVKTEEPEAEPRKEVEIANRSFADRLFEAIDSNDFIAFNKTTMKVLRKLKLSGADWNLITYIFEMTVGYNFTLKKPQGKKIKSRRAPGIKKKNQNWIYPKTIMENTGIDAHLYRNISRLEKMGIITVHQTATKSRPYKIEFKIRWDKWNIKKDIIRTGLEELEKISEKAKK